FKMEGTCNGWELKSRFKAAEGYLVGYR
ncbi:hypothetical protein A2U01_0112122, partial [Trifolium medium]|nr:hypothetical protein [Trifolium medium]